MSVRFVFFFLPPLVASLLCSCGEPHDGEDVNSSVPAGQAEGNDSQAPPSTTAVPSKPTKTFTENCRIGICECPEVEKTWCWQKVGLRHKGDVFKFEKLWKQQTVTVRKLEPPNKYGKQKVWVEDYNSRQKHTKEAKQALSEPDKQTQEDGSDLEQDGNLSKLLFGSLASLFVIFFFWFFLSSKRKTRGIPQPKDECPMCGGSVSLQDEKCPNPDCGVVL